MTHHEGCLPSSLLDNFAPMQVDRIARASPLSTIFASHSTLVSSGSILASFVLEHVVNRIRYRDVRFIVYLDALFFNRSHVVISLSIVVVI